jgi:putative PEP-CTERM system integral membrane protein
MIKKILNSKILRYLIFYGWNICFVVLALTLESTERIFSEIVYHHFNGETPVSYLICTAIVCLLPLISLILSFTVFNYDSRKLVRWFYGVEIPILFLSLFRTFAFNQLTQTSTLWFVLLALGIAAYAAILFKPIIKKRSLYKSFAIIQLYGGFLIIVLVSLMLIPLIGGFLIQFFTSGWWRDIELRWIFEVGFVVLLGLLFFCISCTLFILSPLAYLRYFVLENIEQIRADWSGQKTGQLLAMGLAIALLTPVLFPFAQPQHEALLLAKEWRKGRVEKATLVEQEEDIKHGLLNAYLFDHRYPLRFDIDFYEELYEELLDVEIEWPQHAANAILQPFIFQGDYNAKVEAEQYYEYLFDAPIERAEMSTIAEAMASTYNPWRVRDDILAVLEEQVLVTDRSATITREAPGFLTLELHERYLNQTYRNQEVFYYFTLPPSAIVTNMWLSDTDEDVKKYEANISPRGAAQQLYQEEKRARRDPALLEQVGPYQYRLRVFPIPGKPYVPFRKRNEEEAAGKPMHLTLEVLCAIDEAGEIGLPELTEKRNVYWNKSESGLDEDAWFQMETSGYKYVEQGQNRRLAGVEVEQKALSDLPKRHLPKRINVLIDGSYSMSEHFVRLEEQLGLLEAEQQLQLFIVNQNEIEAVESLDAIQETDFIGVNEDLRVLEQWQQQHKEAVVYLTDEGSYELLDENAEYKALALNKSVDVVHISGYAPIYEDAFKESVLRSGGNFYNGISNWLKVQQADFDRQRLHYVDGTDIFFFDPSADTTDKNESYASEAIDGHHYAVALSAKAEQLDTTTLDYLHWMASTYHFASPYSSMICLVNERQEKRLKELSEGNDRYEREIETGNNANDLLNVKGTPEPHEWAMIFFVLGLILFLYRKKLLGFVGWRS